LFGCCHRGRSSDGFLVSLWCTSLISQDETSTDPDCTSTEHQGSSNSLSVVDTTGSNDLHRLARPRAGLAFAELDHRWYQNGRGNIASVATALASLCADDVNTKIEALLDVFRVANHVHVQNAGFVEAVDDMLGWDTDGGDEELGAAVDDNSHELVEFAFCVIVAVLNLESTFQQSNWNSRKGLLTLSFGRYHQLVE
jgi:hypothetical protein